MRDKLGEQLAKEIHELSKEKQSYLPFVGQIVSFCKDVNDTGNYFRSEVLEIIEQGGNGVLPVVRLKVFGRWIWNRVWDEKDEPYEVTALMHRNGIYQLKKKS